MGHLTVDASMEFQGVASALACAKQCVMMTLCMSFDYSLKLTECHILTVSENSTVVRRHFGDYQHYPRLGTGHSTQFSDPLSLAHNTVYYVNVILRNRLGHSAVISSPPVKVDLTPPLPGVLSSSASDTLISNANCTAAVTQRCVQQTTVSNHRYVWSKTSNLMFY